jgi:hypothetical protein
VGQEGECIENALGRRAQNESEERHVPLALYDQSRKRLPNRRSQGPARGVEPGCRAGPRRSSGGSGGSDSLSLRKDTTLRDSGLYQGQPGPGYQSTEESQGGYGRLRRENLFPASGQSLRAGRGRSLGGGGRIPRPLFMEIPMGEIVNEGLSKIGGKNAGARGAP